MATSTMPKPLNAEVDALNSRTMNAGIIHSGNLDAGKSISMDSSVQLVTAFRYFSNSNIYGIWVVDFGETIGTLAASNLSNNISCTYSNGRWTLKNLRSNGYITYIYISI